MDKILENADGSDPEIFKKYDRLKERTRAKDVRVGNSSGRVRRNIKEEKIGKKNRI